MLKILVFAILFQLFYAEIIPYCNLERNFLICSEFTSFDQLDFTNLKINIDYIQIESLIELELNSSLNLTGLNKNQTNKLIFKNLNGFNPFENIFLQMNSNNLSLEITSSKWLLNFDCNYYNEILLFENLNLFEFKIKDSEFISPICPILFRNTTIKRFWIQSISPLQFNSSYNDFNIDIQELYIYYGYEFFIQILDNTSLLNEDMFKNIKLLEINQCYIKKIDSYSLLRLKKLREFRLINLNLENLFKNGIDWLDSINLNSKEIFLLKFSISPVFTFEFGDNEFCFFKSFPHENLIVPLFYYSDNDFDSVELEYILPCSCTIYWFYRDSYINASIALTNTSNEKYFPYHCFNIDQILIDEQLEYCQNDIKALECNNQTTVNQIKTTSIPLDTTKTICDYCECSFNKFLNILECNNDSLITTPPNFDVNSSIQFDYVSLVGSSIKKLNTNEFKNLRLKENATIVVSNINEFESNLFSESLIYTKQFSFIVYNSSLLSLYFREPFKKVNISRLEFINCNLTEPILTSGFIDSFINVLSISEPIDGSLSPSFSRLFFGKIHIFKFEIKDAFNIYRLSEKQFGIDFQMLNNKMFEYLEELEIKNTYLDYIQSNAFNFLLNLKVVRLENVNLKNIIEFYFLELNFLETIDFNDQSINWMANNQIERVYFGREQFSEFDFNYENEYLCYFAGLNENKRVFIYDSIDFFIISNFECTCTIYWLYSKLDDLELVLKNDYDSRYIPNCIKDLKNSSNLKSKLEICLDGKDPNVYCKILPTTILEDTTISNSSINDSLLYTTPSTIIYTSINNSTFSTSKTLDTTIHYENNNQNILQNILISLLVITILIFLVLITFLIIYSKNKIKTNRKYNSSKIELVEVNKF